VSFSMSGLFDGIAQLDLEYDGHRGRLPLFFRDMAMTTAVFAARASALRRLLPDARFVPARLAPGVGLVAVAGVEYRDSDVGAYREVLVAIPIQERPGPQLPARSLLAGVLRGSERCPASFIRAAFSVSMRAASTCVAMSASLNWMAWCSAIGTPNVLRSWA